MHCHKKLPTSLLSKNSTPCVPILPLKLPQSMFPFKNVQNGFNVLIAETRHSVFTDVHLLKNVTLNAVVDFRRPHFTD